MVSTEGKLAQFIYWIILYIDQLFWKKHLSSVNLWKQVLIISNGGQVLCHKVYFFCTLTKLKIFWVTHIWMANTYSAHKDFHDP